MLVGDGGGRRGGAGSTHFASRQEFTRVLRQGKVCNLCNELVWSVGTVKVLCQ